MATEFVEEAIEEIDEGASFRPLDDRRVLMEFTVAGTVRRFAMRIRPFRQSIRRANQASDAWAEDHPGEVVSLYGRERRA